MKRMHVNVTVANVEQSLRFYTELFQAPPTLRKPDYARWVLDDPRVNFAISRCGPRPGVNHLGLQVDDDTELTELYARMERAGGPQRDEGETTCCYARSTKRWLRDPQGVNWEAFITHGEAEAGDRCSAESASG